MSTQPYASEDDTAELMRLGQLPTPLRLADLLEKTMQCPLHGKAADELRRLHEANAELLEALEGVTYWDNGKSEWKDVHAAIAKHGSKT